MADFAASILDLALPYYEGDGGGGIPADDPSFELFDLGLAAAPRTVSPVFSYGASKAGSRTPTSGERILERIHAIPTLIPVGTVTDPVEVSAILWNAFRAQAAVLQSIGLTRTQGISFSGIEAFDILAALGDVEVDFTVTEQGPVAIDAIFDFVFDIGSADIEIVGQRGAVILSRPLANGYSETWSFETEIFRSQGGKEWTRSKFAPGDAPRAGIKLPVSALNRLDLNRLENALRFGARYPVGVPLWWSLSRLSAATDGSEVVSCPTAERRFQVGGGVLLLSRGAARSGVHAVRIVESVEPSGLILNAPVDADEFLPGDFVLPLLSCAAPNSSSLSSGADGFLRGRGTISFEELG